MEINNREAYFASHTTEELDRILQDNLPVAILLPTGSTEPHGPHLPLQTDTLISRASSEYAIDKLRDHDIHALVGPSIEFGVTECASQFTGAISVPPAVLEEFLEKVVSQFLEDGFDHVCLVNNHLEPDHNNVVTKLLDHFPEGGVSAATPLTKKWARTLSDEFKSGACHAGRYETSILLASYPDRVRTDIMRELPEVNISLSENLQNGIHDFVEMGLQKAYAGAPSEASVEEGDKMLDRLSTMIEQEVIDGVKSSTQM